MQPCEARQPCLQEISWSVFLLTAMRRSQNRRIMNAYRLRRQRPKYLIFKLLGKSRIAIVPLQNSNKL
jgi:hypothetical protein